MRVEKGKNKPFFPLFPDCYWRHFSVTVATDSLHFGRVDLLHSGIGKRSEFCGNSGFPISLAKSQQQGFTDCLSLSLPYSIARRNGRNQLQSLPCRTRSLPCRQRSVPVLWRGMQQWPESFRAALSSTMTGPGDLPMIIFLPSRLKR